MEITPLLKELKARQQDFKSHKTMFEIYEGNLNKHLDEWLSSQIIGESVNYAQIRKCPINLLRKIVDKLSQIYQAHPLRTVPNGTDMDQFLLDYYTENMKLDKNMNIANEFFNMSRATLLQPYVSNGKPRIRAIPNDRFIVFSDDDKDPMSVTHVAVIQGCDTIDMTNFNQEKSIFYAYSKDEFTVFDSSGEIRRDLMEKEGNPEGVNPFGALPFVYVNRSSNVLIPPPDLELKQMIILIAGLLTDLNFASMFSLFSIMYGIDITDTNLKLNPNAFWQLKSDPASDKKPELGTIKNEADVTETLELIRSQLSMFLNSRSIKTSTIGDLETSNFASGISKMLDESDTFEERQRQVSYFKQAETDLWELIIHNLHPVWSASGYIDQRNQFSAGAYVMTDFRLAQPMQKRGDLVKDLAAEVDAGFTTKRLAIKQLNPDISDDEVDKILGEQSEVEVSKENIRLINDNVITVAGETGG